MSVLQTAINNMCKSCLYDPVQDGSWREQVKKCTAINCPLFSVRPGALRKHRKRKEMTEYEKQKLKDRLTRARASRGLRKQTITTD